ncbi:hypothetical protein QJS66_22450 [Kocuria rhizophila]|nr:hypothetical protein QJS66_22450 [Kocuria rhizophila]
MKACSTRCSVSRRMLASAVRALRTRQRFPAASWTTQDRKSAASSEKDRWPRGHSGHGCGGNGG